MAIKLGADAVSAMYLGAASVDAAYLGASDLALSGGGGGSGDNALTLNGMVLQLNGQDLTLGA